MLKLVVLIVPLGLDTFAVAAALGLAGARGRERARVGLLFAGFEAAMILVGYALGTPIGRLAGRYGDYGAAAVVFALGVWMLAGPEEDEARLASLGRLRGMAAIGLGLSISLDELAFGLALGVLRLAVVPVAVAVGLQALLVSQAGLALGGRLGERAREGSERLAGVALLLLAVGLVVARALE